MSLNCLLKAKFSPYFNPSLAASSNSPRLHTKYTPITHWLHTDYTLINTDHTLITHWLHIDYTLITHWLHTDHTLITHCATVLSSRHVWVTDARVRLFSRLLLSSLCRPSDRRNSENISFPFSFLLFGYFLPGFLQTVSTLEAIKSSLDTHLFKNYLA